MTCAYCCINSSMILIASILRRKWKCLSDTINIRYQHCGTVVRRQTVLFLFFFVCVVLHGERTDVVTDPVILSAPHWRTILGGNFHDSSFQTDIEGVVSAGYYLSTISYYRGTKILGSNVPFLFCNAKKKEKKTKLDKILPFSFASFFA